MTCLEWLMIIAGWIAAWIWTAGASLADLRYSRDRFDRDSPEERLEWESREYRKDLAFSVGWSFLPTAWVLLPFMSGFYQHGWTLSPPRIEEWRKK